MAAPSYEVMKEFKSPARGIELNLLDWIWAGIIVLGASYALYRYHSIMDIYELVILCVAAVSLVAGGWLWKSFRPLGIAVIVLSMFAIYIYAVKVPLLGAGVSGEQAISILSSRVLNNVPNVNKSFFLTYFLASQVATMWMSALFIGATVLYFVHLGLKAATVSSADSFGKFATSMTWSACAMGLIALIVRWRESYIVGADVGHIPVSNLYEVFILFAVFTALIYLFFEQRFKTKTMGAFALLVVTAIIAFLLWYHGTTAKDITPLIPALKSWWMKIHVPANFVGYGSFAFAAMMGILSLLVHYGKPDVSDKQKVAIWAVIMTLAICGLFGWYGGYKSGLATNTVAVMPIIYSLGVALCLIAIGWVSLKPAVNKVLPSARMLEDVMFKSIALGFFWFTIATILGALWAADAWGSYWSWDSKEVWALIVWLNYAAWLHVRFIVGKRDTIMAWWAMIGLFVTLFAFLGVNMFLAGRHSYGGL